MKFSWKSSGNDVAGGVGLSVFGRGRGCLKRWNRKVFIFCLLVENMKCAIMITKIAEIVTQITGIG